MAACRQVMGLIARLMAERAEGHIDDVLGWINKNKKFKADECLQPSLCDAIV